MISLSLSRITIKLSSRFQPFSRFPEPRQFTVPEPDRPCDYDPVFSDRTASRTKCWSSFLRLAVVSTVLTFQRQAYLRVSSPGIHMPSPTKTIRDATDHALLYTSSRRSPASGVISILGVRKGFVFDGRVGTIALFDVAIFSHIARGVAPAQNCIGCRRLLLSFPEEVAAERLGKLSCKHVAARSAR